MKDIDISFRKASATGLVVKEGDAVIFQAINDALKTRFGEVLYSPYAGSFTMDYIKPSIDIFSYLSLRDEIFDALRTISWISVDKKTINIVINSKLRRYEVSATIYDVQTNAALVVPLVFNFK